MSNTNNTTKTHTYTRNYMRVILTITGDEAEFSCLGEVDLTDAEFEAMFAGTDVPGWERS